MNNQIIKPDDFYDMVESAQDGRVCKTTISKEVFESIFLGDINSLDVQKCLAGNINYNVFQVEVLVSEQGRITVQPVRRLPKYGKFTDLGGMDE
jgi:hypothetical protein